MTEMGRLFPPLDRKAGGAATHASEAQGNHSDSPEAK